ncbi:hypothetical protein BH24DEI2_BH24DEI2_21800 [soil metagenome]
MKKTWMMFVLALCLTVGLGLAQESGGETGGAESGGATMGTETGGSDTGGSMMGETGGAMMGMDNLTATLSGSQQVPPNDSEASGEVNATLDGTTLTIEGSFEGLSSDLMEVDGTPAHIHQAPAGENGPVILPLEVEANEDDRSGTLSGTFELTDEQLAAYEAGNLYVNIHTQDYPDGEIRAQLSNAMTGSDSGGESGGG